MQETYKTNYLAQTVDGPARVWIDLDLEPFIVDGLSAAAAAEAACEVFERNSDNFISW
jgi:hypothetical protein